MRTLFENKIGRISLVEGHVAVVGQSTLVGTRVISGQKVRAASSYDYLRFRDVGTGKDFTVRDITTFDNCDAYLSVCSRGRFVIWETLGKSAGKGTVMAVAADGQFVDDVDHLIDCLRAVLRQGQRNCWLSLGIGVPALLFPPAGLTLIGFAIWGLWEMSKAKHLFAQVPDREHLMALIAAASDSGRSETELVAA